MVIYERTSSTEIEIIDRWENGFGWIAHPDEDTRRVSHAMRGRDGVYLFDPLDGPGLRSHLSELGTVFGVVVQSKFHARDANVFAERYDVPVYLPTWMDRVADQVEARVERYPSPPEEWVELGSSGIDARTIDSETAWTEVVVYDRTDDTLRTADLFATVPEFRIGNERLGVYILHRLSPPTAAFTGVDPERILVGHGEGVFDDASETLNETLSDARRHLPRALLTQLPAQTIAFVVAMRE